MQIRKDKQSLDSPARRLFSPGPVSVPYSTELTYSHRSPEFESLYGEVRSRLLSMSGFRNVVFTQGSASSAVETVFCSVLQPSSRLLMLVNGEFGRRAAHVAGLYTNCVTEVTSIESLLNKLKTQDFDFCYVVQFETSLSVYNELHEVETLCQLRQVNLIVDAVSAYPFYALPRARFAITSSSKQLRGLPAMGLIFYDSVEDLQLLERASYLNLKKYIEYGFKNQTPHTSLIPQFESLSQSLSTFDIESHRRSVCDNALALTHGLMDYVVNEPICPVVTFAVKDVEAIVQALSAEGICAYFNQFYMSAFIQIGCFNYDSTDAYVALNRSLFALKHLLRATALELQ